MFQPKLLILTTLFFIVSWFFNQPVHAQETQHAVIVNPIRGGDFWINSMGFLDTPKGQYDIVSKYQLPATWLVRYDALKNPEVVSFLRSLNSQQEVGLFLEVTPTLTKDASVTYNQSPNWHYAQSVFLVGYSPDDRRKMIDKAVSLYQRNFGTNPKSVGAWWIDAYSLRYLRDKYGIEANLDVADQYSTDQYQVWGQYWSTPFYPSKVNALMPAQSTDTKIGVVTIQWATRDPYNAYGNGANESTYSVQPNDYMLHGLDINYFKKLLDIYPQVTVGLENDFSFADLGKEYESQIKMLAERQQEGTLTVQNMYGFAKYYQSRYPTISPDVLITSNDPLGGEGKVVWYQTQRYRLGWFYGPYGSTIRDLRLFNDSLPEPCLATACNQLNLAISATKALDDVTFADRWLIDEGKISNFKVTKDNQKVEISYVNQAGTERKIRLFPNDVEVDGKIQPVSFAILNAINVSQTTSESKVNLKLGTKIDYGRNGYQILISFLKFIALTIIFFFLPGWFITRKLLYSIPVGWIIFTLVAFILGFLKFSEFIWSIPIISLLLLFRKGLPKFGLPKIDLKLVSVILVIVLGSGVWLLTSVKNSLIYEYGLGFWGPNGHDGVWHLALISDLQRNFPPQNPIFGGELLYNYHYFYDLLVARSGALFQIDNQDLLFRFFPLLISILAGLILFEFVKKLSSSLSHELSFKAGLLALFFMYFGGSFGWVVSYFKDRSFGGESLFWSQQSISTLLNPPFAISIVFVLLGLTLMVDYLKFTPKVDFRQLFKRDWWKNLKLSLIIPLVLIFGSIIEFKVYGEILVLISLGLVTLEYILLHRDFKLLPVFIFSVLVSALVFLPNNFGSSSLIEYKPLWLIYSMIDSQDRLGWQRLTLALQSGVLYKVIIGYLLGIGIFLAGNLGTRLLFLLDLKTFWRNRLLFYIALSGIILPMFFIQKGNSWNIVQFFYYSLLMLGIFASITLAKLWMRLGNVIGTGAVLIVVLLTLPITMNTLSQYLPERSPARLSMAEFEALNFLSEQPPGIVLTMPFDPMLKKQYSEPLPLYAYAPTAYVAAFSNHPTFVDDQINLDILGIDYKGRVNLQRDFVKIRDHSKEILISNNIAYVYAIKASGFEVDENKMGIRKIFENDEVQIFKATN